MDRPRRDSIRRPASYANAWWDKVDLDRQKSALPRQVDAVSGLDSFEETATSFDRETYKWTSDSSREMVLSIDFPASENEEFNTYRNVPKTHGIPKDLEPTRARGNNSSSSRKRKGGSGGGSKRRMRSKKRRKTAQSSKSECREPWGASDTDKSVSYRNKAGGSGTRSRSLLRTIPIADSS
jgi:hypothetical protein